MYSSSLGVDQAQGKTFVERQVFFVFQHHIASLYAFHRPNQRSSLFLIVVSPFHRTLTSSTASVASIGCYRRSEPRIELSALTLCPINKLNPDPACLCQVYSYPTAIGLCHPDSCILILAPTSMNLALVQRCGVSSRRASRRRAILHVGPINILRPYSRPFPSSFFLSLSRLCIDFLLCFLLLPSTVAYCLNIPHFETR